VPNRVHDEGTRGFPRLRGLSLPRTVGVALAVVNRLAPDRANPRRRRVGWGAVVALVLWLLASIWSGSSVDNLGNYDETYGALAAVIILLLWLFLTAFVVPLGAELERRTAKDTTTGPPRPLGRRGAGVADTLGDGPPRR
jgi:membrane protein